MKSQRDFPSVTITKKAEYSVQKGHPWVYGEEIVSSRGEFTNGCLVDVFSGRGSYMGTGFYSERSKIRVRILSNNANEAFQSPFFDRRAGYAIDYRLTVMPEDMACCRLIFGEADGMPGLTVDRYGDVLVTQVLSYGMEVRKDQVYRSICDQLRARGLAVGGIYERNDVAIRELEGLPQTKGWYEADFAPHGDTCLSEIVENGIHYTVDFENGQKTGFFLDQKYNRLAAAMIARGKRVLDCFTHTGSFALNAAKQGAAHVTAVDVSERAVEMARENAVRNGLDGVTDFVCADVFELLPELCEQHAHYDMIILDPPAFTKSRRTIDSAERGYKEINVRAMRLLPRGGYLATCSCSHFMDSRLFEQMLVSAARDAGVSLKLIEARRQSPDHPTLMTVPETDYLKFYLFQIV